MLRKFVVLVFAVLMLVSVAVFATACSNKEHWVGAENIYNDGKYVDYAKEAFYDIEKFPELAEHGLFWATWDEQTNKEIRVKAATKEGAALVDPNKPTIIIVHGMMGGSYALNSYATFYLGGGLSRPEEFDLQSNGDISLVRLWERAGWNVGIYRWNAFSAEGNDFGAVEAKIWSVDGSQKVSHRNPKGELVFGASNYSVAENFAADYIRATKLLPETFGDKEIRVAGHSMGGVLVTTTVFLIGELSRNGQLPEKQAPDRLALLDPGFGVNIEIDGKTVLSSETDFTISWSKKPLVNKSTSETMIELIKDMTAHGVVVEYYAYETSWAMMSIKPSILTELNTYSTFVFIRPDYKSYNPRYDFKAWGHTMVFEYYLFSIAFPPVTDVTEGAQEGALALSASTPTDYMRDNLRGVKFVMEGGAKTVPTTDDTFIRVSPIAKELGEQ